MALDRRFRFLKRPRPSAAPADLATLVDEAAFLTTAHRPVLLVGGGERPIDRLAGLPPGAAVYLPSGDVGTLEEALRALHVTEGNLYTALAPAGALVIDPAELREGGVKLSGGSFATVTLHLTDDGRAVVRKEVSRHPIEDPDREGRHRREANLLASLPPETRTLFPRVLEVIEDDQVVGVAHEFVPAPTIGELVFQEQLTGEQVAGLLRDVYTSLRSHLYELDVPGLAMGEGYPSTIARRRARIASSGHPSARSVMDVLEAPSVSVNGRSVPSLRQVLEAVRAEPRWGPVVDPQGKPRLVHGDLVLEDVLVTSDRGFRLVDPGPGNRHPVLDATKTLLSLWLLYEVIYYDLFELSTRRGRDGHIDIELTLGRPGCQEQYAAAAELFVAFARKELVDLLGLPLDADFERLLRMGAALHALALPMFHLLHHDREKRAIAFITAGLIHAAHALEGRCGREWQP